MPILFILAAPVLLIVHGHFPKPMLKALIAALLAPAALTAATLIGIGFWFEPPSGSPSPPVFDAVIFPLVEAHLVLAVQAVPLAVFHWIMINKRDAAEWPDKPPPIGDIGHALVLPPKLDTVVYDILRLFALAWLLGPKTYFDGPDFFGTRLSDGLIAETVRLMHAQPLPLAAILVSAAIVIVLAKRNGNILPGLEPAPRRLPRAPKREPLFSSPATLAKTAVSSRPATIETIARRRPQPLRDMAAG